MSLDGRSILVTGAGRGLGLALARRLGEDGATLWLADIREDWGEDAAEGLRADGVKAQFVRVDLRDAESVDAMAATVTAGGPLYGLVNNAALADGVGGKPIHELGIDEWDRVLGVNLRGTFLVSRAIVPSIIGNGGGRVVTIGSDAALYGSPRLAHYIASKGGVAALTRAMSRDLGPHGITVNTVSPGLTESESAQQVPEHRHELYRLNRALERPQQPSDLVGAVAFLMGPEASYITGQQLVVNGGFVLN
ncbi:NAD(P)-dependent dehydrogenase (short-subunit alcohol dehydrogenase family) [Rhodococcus wratislaviensis]|uniref:3-ketoacyl-ACP reductase n=1 Tax=Rhodococcus wratislaviensis TaxID=44752 RepID=A0AB38FLB9_RHOWR|nr:3-oxoacyl-ACP reductase family protein [Rhodococcus wratislaviensis]REE74531.1 NAD(P)-dependent dehydrogenase (short-subunit alcohol dehydrogenase family) [Rhodococcus wratislaviensis]SPZ41932.1 3-ketoacyl-ACP reductase [Rhodococcus wratislaviensis]